MIINEIIHAFQYAAIKLPQIFMICIEKALVEKSTLAP